MIQCVGSRNEEYPNCSRVCCQTAIKNALHIKQLNPDANVYILYRDIRTYGEMEYFYREARREGVLFFRFEKDKPPQVESDGDDLTVWFKDHVLQRDIKIAPDLLALSAGVRAADTDELASVRGIGLATAEAIRWAVKEARPDYGGPDELIFPL